MIAIIFAIITGLVPLVIYSIYSIAVLTAKDYEIRQPDVLPPITVVIPAYNEAEVIEHRIQNLSQIDYPSELIDVIVVDDRSDDDTVFMAQNAFEVYSIKGQVIKKEQRTGTNVSVNMGIAASQNDIVVTTDADVIFENSAIKNALGVLLADDSIGAVCGELTPIITDKTFTTNSEVAYRSVYGKMCTWESKVHSTYCFNGPLIVLRKNAFSPISAKYGASDAGMALNIIRNGYRCLYVSAAKFSEYIAVDVRQQKRQKLRRAARLLEATISNIGLISPKYGKFGMIVLPLRTVMFVIAPTAMFMSFVLWFYVLVSFEFVYGLAFLGALLLLLLSGYAKQNIISSFIWHQIYLIIGLLYAFRGVNTWKAIKRVKIE